MHMGPCVCVGSRSGTRLPFNIRNHKLPRYGLGHHINVQCMDVMHESKLAAQKGIHANRRQTFRVEQASVLLALAAASAEKKNIH